MGFGIEALLAGAGNGGGIDGGSSRGAVAVNAIGAGAEGQERLAFIAGEVEGTGECELLVASAAAMLFGQLHGEFSGRKEAETGVLAA